MLSRLSITSFASAVVLAGGIWAQQPPPGQTTPPDLTGPPGAPRATIPGNPGAIPQDQQVDPYATDKDFVRNVADSSAIEVYLGKLAQDKASSDAVKEFGKQMAEVNTQKSQQLKQAAAALNIQLPAAPPRKAKKAEDKLAKLSGTDFDRAYAKMAADEQKQAVKQFEREARSGRVPGVKDFAAKNLPAEQERQKQAEGLAGAGSGTPQK